MMLLATTLNVEKFPSMLDTQPSRESLTGHLSPIDTLRRLRPLRRRAARILRPLRVAERARKP